MGQKFVLWQFFLVPHRFYDIPVQLKNGSSLSCSKIFLQVRVFDLGQGQRLPNHRENIQPVHSGPSSAQDNPVVMVNTWCKVILLNSGYSGIN